MQTPRGRRTGLAHVARVDVCDSETHANGCTGAPAVESTLSASHSLQHAADVLALPHRTSGACVGSLLTFEERLSDLPFVERIWRSHSERAGTFLSVAACHFEMAVTRHQGKTFITLRGPETKATTAECPANGEWLGVRFKLGTFMPQFTPGRLRDRNDVTLPDATTYSFWLNGSAWEYPTFENAETFAKRLVTKSIVVHDASIDAALHDLPGALSLRSAQRHFLRAAGITRGTMRQIERARYAANLLRQGVSILDAVYLAGYFDQAHLTRSLKCRMGQTPADLKRARQQLSFLYKTAPLL
jgi:hypothetical protein